MCVKWRKLAFCFFFWFLVKHMLLCLHFVFSCVRGQHIGKGTQRAGEGGGGGVAWTYISRQAVMASNECRCGWQKELQSCHCKRVKRKLPFTHQRRYGDPEWTDSVGERCALPKDSNHCGALRGTTKPTGAENVRLRETRTLQKSNSSSEKHRCNCNPCSAANVKECFVLLLLLLLFDEAIGEAWNSLRVTMVMVEHKTQSRRESR